MVEVAKGVKVVPTFLIWKWRSSSLGFRLNRFCVVLFQCREEAL